MLSTKPSLMITLFFCMGQGKKHYSTAAINTILELLSKFHKIEIKRRWLFQCMKDLTDAGLMKRNTRYVHNENGLIAQIPSMIIFKLKGIVWLAKMGVKGAKAQYKAMVKFVQKEDKRFPTKKDFDDGSWWPEAADQRAALENLLGIVPKDIS